MLEFLSLRHVMVLRLKENQTSLTYSNQTQEIVFLTSSN